MPTTKSELGPFLKSVRSSIGYTLREVEAKTGGRIKNGYLSQVENGQIANPSASMLWELADLYGLEYGELLEKAGYRRPSSNERIGDVPRELYDGIPLRALAELNADERAELRRYLEFLSHRRSSGV